MKKATTILLLTVTALAITASCIWAQAPAGLYEGDTWDVYVRNKFLGNFTASGGTIFAPVSSFLKALRFSATQGSDGLIQISSEPGTVDSIQGTPAFVYNGVRFTVPCRPGRNGLAVDIRKMSANLGISCIISKETGIIDIVVPQGMSAAQFQTEQNLARAKGARSASSASATSTDLKQSGDQGPKSTGTPTRSGISSEGETSTATKAGLEQGPVDSPKSATGTPTASQAGKSAAPSGGGTSDESPVKQIGEIGGFADDRTGQCYWNVTIKNTGTEVVKNVIITLHIADGTGKDIDTQIKPIGNMNAGDQSKLDFYWQGGIRLIFTPKVEIKHDPIPKPEPPKPPATK